MPIISQISNKKKDKFFAEGGSQESPFLISLKMYLIDKPSNFYQDTKFKHFFNRIAISPILELILGLSIVINTITISLDRYPISEKENQILEMINIVITFIFTFEMVIKIFGFGLINYFLDKWNWIDFVVVCFCLVDFTITLDNDTIKNNNK